MIEPDQANTLFDKIASRAQSAAARLHVKSALNPMLWLCGIVSVPCMILACIAHIYGAESLAFMFGIVGTIPVVGTVIGFCYFMIVAPEKLQSEDYQIRHETIELIKEKGSAIEIVPSSLEVITNPIHLRVSGTGQ